MKKSLNYFFSLALLFSAIIFTPGCEWFKKNVGGCTSCAHHHAAPAKDGEVSHDHNHGVQSDIPGSVGSKTVAKDVAQGSVLLSTKDKDLLTKQEFEQYCSVVCELEPQYKQIIEAIPESKVQLFKDLATQKVIQEWADTKGLTQGEDFKKKLQFQKENMERSLAMQEFYKYLQENLLNFTDAQQKEFYEKEKAQNPVLQQPPFLEKEEGVLAKGVKFDSEEQAKAFLDKLKNHNLNLDELAKKENTKVEDFGAVNEQSYALDSNLRDKVLEFKKYPEVAVVKGDEDKEFWVVKAANKQKAAYAAFNKVKDEVKQAMMQAKAPEIYEKEIEKIKKELGIKEETKSLDEEIKQHKAKMAEEFKKQQANQKDSQSKDSQVDQADLDLSDIANQVKGA